MDSSDKFFSIFWVCVATVICVCLLGQVGLLIGMIGIPAVALAKGE